MNELKVIDERELLGKEFRIYGDYDNPLFLAKDVATWIEHSNPSKMVSTIDDDEKTTITISYNGNMTTNQLFLTEDGLYEVLMQSRKPIAKEFKKEVKNILKSIRKNGAYMTENTLEKALTSPDFLIQLATKLKDEQEARRIAEEKVKEKDKQLELQQPMVDFTNTVLKSKDNILVRQLAKLANSEGINIGEKRLYSKMREWGMILPNSTEPYQRYVDNGTFVIDENPVETPYKTILTRTTKVTPLGQIKIIEKLKKEYNK